MRDRLIAMVAAGLLLGMSGEDPDFAAARQAFEQGLAALDAKQTDAAITAFETSIRLRTSLPALYNLGLAYRAADRRQDAIVVFDRFLDGASQKGDTPGVAHAKVLVESLRAALVHVSLEVRGDATALEIDGRPFGDGAGTYGLVLEPGTHVLAAVRRDGTRIEHRAQMTAGSRVVTTLDATPELPKVAAPPPIVAVAPPVSVAAPDDESSTMWWLAGAFIVVAAVSASAITFAITRDGEPTYDGGTRGILLRGLGGEL